MPGLRILVVDDEPSLAEALADLLRMHGHGVATAANGAEALQLASREHFQLVLSDLVMPVMDGHELMRALHREPRKPFWFVLMSALPASLQGPHPPGCARLMTKPVHLDDLLEVVRACVTGLSPGRDASDAC